MAKKPYDSTALGVKLLKSLTDFMKKMDSTWDEYARIHLDDKKLKGYSYFQMLKEK